MNLPSATGYITPIGPFCPFRSASCATGAVLDQQMGSVTGKMPQFAAEMARLQLTMQTGGEPDVARVRSMAQDLSEAEEQWRAMLTRMQFADDFQMREYYKMTAAWSKRQGESLESIGLMMRWQADCMKAFANGQPPLPPPPGVDLAKLARQQQEQMQGGGGAGPSNMMAQMNSAQSVDSTPFTGAETAFESEVVKKEYEALCRSHNSLIKLGEGFGTFDPLGKLAYLDELEKVEERWDVFFQRFALLGELNPTFKQQTDEYLSGMGMSATDFREVLAEAHGLMRADAEKERAAAP